MKMMWLTTVAIAAAIAAPAHAEAVKSVVTSSNGVEVTVYYDEFANLYEYTSPSIRAGDGFVMVAARKNGGVAPPSLLTGAFVYSGEWRRYNSAVFKGGASAKFIEEGRKVNGCQAWRYSSPTCTLSETFRVELTPTDIEKNAQDGKLSIQVRALDASTTVMEVPVAFIDAVNEVAHR